MQDDGLGKRRHAAALRTLPCESRVSSSLQLSSRSANTAQPMRYRLPEATAASGRCGPATVRHPLAAEGIDLWSDLRVRRRLAPRVIVFLSPLNALACLPRLKTFLQAFKYATGATPGIAFPLTGSHCTACCPYRGSVSVVLSAGVAKLAPDHRCNCLWLAP